MQGEIEQLRQAFEGFKEIPFPSCIHPRPSSDLGDNIVDTLDDVHTALLMHDMDMAGQLWCVTYGQPPAYPLEPNTALRGDLERLVSEGSPLVASYARAYLGYLDQLEGLIEMANCLADYPGPGHTG